MSPNRAALVRMPEHRQWALVSRIIDECRYAPGSATARRVANETLPLPTEEDSKDSVSFPGEGR